MAFLNLSHSEPVPIVSYPVPETELFFKWTEAESSHLQHDLFPRDQGDTRFDKQRTAIAEYFKKKNPAFMREQARDSYAALRP